MLRGIDPVLIGQCLHVLDDMGHGDTLALVDRNYPAHASGRPVIHLGEISAERAAQALVSVFPLDTFIDRPLGRMLVDGSDSEHEVHDAVLRAAQAAHGSPLSYEIISRQDFYARATDCRVIFQCLESAPYSCFIFTKGVV